MAGKWSLESWYEQDDRDYKRTEEEDDEEIKKIIEGYHKNLPKENMGSDESEPYFLYDDDDDEEDLDEIKDPGQMQAQEEKDIKPKLSSDDDAAVAAAVKNVLEGIIQSHASKKICDVHHLDQQILTKLLQNLKDSITQQTLNQLTNRPQLAEDTEISSPVPLQAPPHDKVQAHEQQQERKRKLTRSYIPDSAAAAAAVNNVLEELTQLPASKKICYAHDDDDEEKPLKNSITQETSINLQNVSEQVADNETAFLASCGKVMRNIKDNITEEDLLNEINEIIRLPKYADKLETDSKATQHANAAKRR